MTFDFKVIQTEHFEVYFYEQEHAAALVEIHLEVLGLDDLEVEGPVLDLVLPEVLRRERRRAAQRERRQRGHQRPSHEGHPSSRGSPGATTGASPQRRSSW